jgi:hypothetical protein
LTGITSWANSPQSKYIYIQGCQFAIAGRSFSGLFTTDICTNDVVFLRITSFTGDFNAAAFYVKRFLQSALKRPGKTLIFLLSTSILESSNGFPYLQGGVSKKLNAVVGANSYYWPGLILTERLLGISFCGYRTSDILTTNIFGNELGFKPAFPSYVGGGAPAPSPVNTSGITNDVLFFKNGGLPGYLAKINETYAKGIVFDSYNPPVQGKKQKRFLPLISALAEKVGSNLFVLSHWCMNNLDEIYPMQALYGDVNYPHSWIKGVSEESIASLDLPATATSLGASKTAQYATGIDIDPATLPYFELKRTPQDSIG